MDNLRIADNVISTPLCTAARNGQSDAVSKLLRKGHNVNLNDNRGWTPLHEAVAHGHINCAKLLLQQEECNVDVCTYDGMTPVFVACQFQNNLELVKLLIEHGVSCNIGNLENVTPLHIVSKFYKVELVKELVKQDADINAQDFNNFTPLMEAIDQISNVGVPKPESSLEVVHFLLDSGASISSTDRYGRTALFIATCVGWKECIQLLLEYGSDVNARTTGGETALLVAAQSGNLRIVKFLLDHGAASDITCDSGTLPLHHAIHNGYVRVAEEIFRKMDCKDIREIKKKKIESFLILAIDSGSSECFKFVMGNKLYTCEDCTAFSSTDSTTMLSYTCFRHYVYQSPLSFLLSHHIEKLQLKSMLECLLDLGFSVNANNQDFLPPLVALIAASFRSANEVHISKVKQECFTMLLQQGADLDYISVKNCPGSLAIPDAVMTVITHSKCCVQQSLLLPVLAHCFACDWDDLLDWVVKYHTCNADVLSVLIQLSTKTRQSFLKLWGTAKQCTCDLCKEKFPNIRKLIFGKESTLQALSRARVRLWLWQKTGRSNEAERFLHRMHIPLLLKQYIVPENV